MSKNNEEHDYDDPLTRSVLHALSDLSPDPLDHLYDSFEDYHPPERRGWTYCTLADGECNPAQIRHRILGHLPREWRLKELYLIVQGSTEYHRERLASLAQDLDQEFLEGDYPWDQQYSPDPKDHSDGYLLGVWVPDETTINFQQLHIDDLLPVLWAQYEYDEPPFGELEPLDEHDRDDADRPW